MSAHPASRSEPISPAGDRRGALLAGGAILVLIGLAAFALRTVDLDLGAAIGDQTWPLLVIVPGLVLLALSFVRTPPEGLGFAIGGSIVTTVGLILLIQANTETWASWAYVWALIPGAAGLAMAGYGAATRTTGLVDRGVRMLVISAVMFLVGWWYFEAVFATGEPPIDIGTWWPLALVGAGVIVAARAVFPRRRRSAGGDVTESEAESEP